MRKIYANQYYDLFYDDKVSLLKFFFKEETKNYTSSIMKREATRFRDYVYKLKCTYLIIDITNYKYKLSEEETTWIASLFTERYARKVAVICDENDLVVKLNTSMVLEQINDLQGKVRFFDTYDEAMQWIGKDYLYNSN